MKPRLYPVSTWLVLVVCVPLAFVGAGAVVVAVTDQDTLFLDSAHLWWLGGLVPLAGLTSIYGAARKRRSLERFTSRRLAPHLTPTISFGRQAFRAGLFVLSITLVVAALIGPRWGTYLQKQQVHGVDVVVALDVSRSMLADDVEPNRITRAKRGIQEQLVDRAAFQRANRLALLAFAGSTSLRMPLTTDHLAFRNKLELTHVGSAPRGGTAIAEAIQRSIELLHRSPEGSTRVIMLLTDGEDHEGQPVDAARTAWEEHGIHVFTVGVGDPNRTVGVQLPSAPGSRKPMLHDGQIVFSRVDVAGLQRIASAGGGEFVPLADLHELVSAIAAMRRAALSTEERIRRRPQYQWFLAAALLLLALETIMGETQPGAPDRVKRLWQPEAST